jgi:hypothetical protein
VTALIGLSFPDLMGNRPSLFDNPLTGTVHEIALALRGYAELGIPHVIFQCQPYNSEALLRLTEALRLYRDMPGAGATN